MKVSPPRDGVGKCGILGEEAEAWVDRLRARRERRLDHAIAAQVRVGGCGTADVDREVGHLHVLRMAVGIGEDGDRLDAHPTRGPSDADGDLAAVGDEDALEHIKMWHAKERSAGRMRCASANGARALPTSEFGSSGQGSFVRRAERVDGSEIAIAMGRVEAETDDADDSSETSSSQSLRATAFTLNGSTWEFENPVSLVLAAARLARHGNRSRRQAPVDCR